MLDLFAGSGALGLEALSRGAAHATFVDSDGRAIAAVKANLEALESPPSAPKCNVAPTGPSSGPRARATVNTIWSCSILHTAWRLSWDGSSRKSLWTCWHPARGSSQRVTAEAPSNSTSRSRQNAATATP